MSSLLAVVVLSLAFHVPCSSVVLRRFAYPCCHQVFDGGQDASRNTFFLLPGKSFVHERSTTFLVTENIIKRFA